jgi:hypothetical protein
MHLFEVKQSERKPVGSKKKTSCPPNATAKPNAPFVQQSSPA